MLFAEWWMRFPEAHVPPTDVSAVQNVAPYEE